MSALNAANVNAQDFLRKKKHEKLLVAQLKTRLPAGSLDVVSFRFVLMYVQWTKNITFLLDM